MSRKVNKKSKLSTVGPTSEVSHEPVSASNDKKGAVIPATKDDFKMVQQSATMSFESLQEPRLSDGVLEYVNKQGFTRMTPVQAAAIPQFLSHKDVAVQSVTGSGKTLAFLIPVLEILQKKTLKRKQIGALILSPTRELAQQTHTVAKGLCDSCDQPEPLLLVGGGSGSNSSSSNARPVTSDVTRFQELGSDLVIGTPGRINDILSRFAVIDCSELICLVLDEADVLLNMGFAATLQNILSHLPKMRRTALFSATQSSSTSSSLAEWMHRIGMRNPVWIDVTIVASQPAATVNDDQAAGEIPTKNVRSVQKYQATPLTLVNYYVVAKLDEKLSRLAAFLQQHADEKIIVFFLTCACVDFFGSAFQKIFPASNDESLSGGIAIEMLHGKMVQKRREKTMERFRNCGNITREGIALFCTDVAARGLDVSDVQWVVQVDAPQDPAFFVHRVGRSARAGNVGQSVIFLTPKEEAYVDFLRMRNIPIEPLPDCEQSSPVLDNVDSECKERKIAGSVADGNTSTSVDILPKILDLVTKDRDVLEKGTRAFTSYIRAYKEHHCSFIFRFASLDLGTLATSFCLLRLPKMPELRDILLKHKGRLPNFTPAGREIDIFAIPYTDKAREQARQKRLQEELAAGNKNRKSIEAERRKAEKEQKDAERRQKALQKGRNPDKKRGRQAQLVDEWEDLAKEERLVKKLRRGKITKEEFNEQMNEA